MATKTGTNNNDYIKGTIGVDSISGLGGNDSLYGDSGNDVLIGGLGNDYLQGDLGNDKLDGGDGDNVLNGGVGADTMLGGNGSDSFYVDNKSDMIIKAANTQADSVHTYIDNYTLGNYLENLYLDSATVITGKGNELNNYLLGSDANNKLFGMAGNDTLDGGRGADVMTGDTGNDVYYVDSSSDKVIESTVSTAATESDMVHSFIKNYTLPVNVENLYLHDDNPASPAINGTGNGSDNQLDGNSKANSLLGLNGNDTLNGAGGNDTLNGGDGSDSLDGGDGADSMLGGTGNDSYIVNDSNDKVVEDSIVATETDAVDSFLQDYTLGANVENLTLTTGWWLNYTAQNGTGNELNNALMGNNLDNTLSGAAGDDMLDGGDWGKDGLNGDAGNDILNGGRDNDTLNGGLGNDLLTGGEYEQDTFVFNTALNATDNLDQISDFKSVDLLQLDPLIFSSLAGLTDGKLTDGMFIAGDGMTKANSAQSYLIYDNATGALYYDADANGTASLPIQFVGLGVGLTSADHVWLAASNFNVA